MLRFLPQSPELGRPKAPVHRRRQEVKLADARAARQTAGQEERVHFVIHAVDRTDALPMRAKFYRAHRIHLDRAGDYGVYVMTAGTLVAPDGETPVGSLFVLEAETRAAVDAFTASDPYHVNGVWQAVDVHYYNKKR
jgi:uncharacterized protein